MNVTEATFCEFVCWMLWLETVYLLHWVKYEKDKVGELEQKKAEFYHKGKELIFGTGISAPKSGDELLKVVKSCFENGIHSFDTAPSYKTEDLLGEIFHHCTKEYKVNREEIFVQTKIDVWQMQEGNGDVRRFVEFTLKSMNLQYLDSLLIHWPIPELFCKTWHCFEELYKENLVRSIGVCNVRLRHMKQMKSLEVLPHIIQIERHPLNVFDEEISFCKENGISIQAYSPLCKMDTRLSESSILMELAKKYQKSIGQIILRWQLDTKAIPVFTSTKTSRIMEYSDIYDFNLSQEEIALVSSHNENYKMYLESRACPGF